MAGLRDHGMARTSGGSAGRGGTGDAAVGATVAEDTFVPIGRIGFIVLVILISAGAWAIGYVLSAPDTERFLKSPEWQVQPFYLAAHLLTLRLFVTTYSGNFRQGIAHFDVDQERAIAAMRRIIGPWGLAFALLVAIPFCYFDYRYLLSDRYTPLSDNGTVRDIDFAMWGIWCLEWFLNAVMWTVLAGFLVVNVSTIRGRDFKAPVEVVLHERHYRPLLRMSSQASTVMLFFSLVTAVYIWRTGGELTDYLGLIVTLVLLIAGFVLPWMALRAKVRREVRHETATIGVELVRGAWRERLDTTEQRAAGGIEAVQARLDYVVAMERLGHLQRLGGNVGASEARALMIRLAAPALTIGWQIANHHAALAEKLGRILQGWAGRLMG
jgi:hypothetical protein